MGLLDQIIGGVLGQAMGGGRGGAMSPIVKALLMILVAKAASGGLGDLLGGGRQEPQPQGSGRPDPGGGDLGGFGSPSRSGAGGDDYSDLSGMLGGGPGQQGNPGTGPSADLGGYGQGAGSGNLGSGFDGLIDTFERGGLGDVIGSWIGKGHNQEVAPNQLDQVLGRDTLDQLVQQTGMSKGDLLSQLAQALPSVIDALTPDGRRPSAEERRGW